MGHASPQHQHDAALTSPLRALLRAAQHRLSVTKPGIVLGNLVSATGGFFLAARGHVDLALFLATMLGTSLIVAAGCVFNNCVDGDIDGSMARTRNRVLPQGMMAVDSALCYAVLLFMAGIALLSVWANTLALAVALLGFVIYVGVYSLYLKRRSTWSTLVGSFSGATPPIIGYCAVSGQFDTTALVLFAIFSLWQMPHFYAITLFRRTDYQAAKIPLLPVATTKRHIVGYIVAFTGVTALPTVLGVTGTAYLVVSLLVGCGWLMLALPRRTEAASDDAQWARRVFLFSMVVVAVVSLMMAVDFV